MKILIYLICYRTLELLKGGDNMKKKILKLVIIAAIIFGIGMTAKSVSNTNEICDPPPGGWIYDFNV